MADDDKKTSTPDASPTKPAFDPNAKPKKSILKEEGAFEDTTPAPNKHINIGAGSADDDDERKPRRALSKKVVEGKSGIVTGNLKANAIRDRSRSVDSGQNAKADDNTASATTATTAAVPTAASSSSSTKKDASSSSSTKKDASSSSSTKKDASSSSKKDKDKKSKKDKK